MLIINKTVLHYMTSMRIIVFWFTSAYISRIKTSCRIRINCCRSRMRPPSFPSLGTRRREDHKPMKEIERVYWKYQASELYQRLNYTQLILQARGANCIFFVARQSSIRIGSAQIQAYSDSLQERSSISRGLCRRRVIFLEGRCIGPFSLLVDELEWKQHFFHNAF